MTIRSSRRGSSGSCRVSRDCRTWREPALRARPRAPAQAPPSSDCVAIESRLPCPFAADTSRNRGSENVSSCRYLPGADRQWCFNPDLLSGLGAASPFWLAMPRFRSPWNSPSPTRWTETADAWQSKARARTAGLTPNPFKLLQLWILQLYRRMRRRTRVRAPWLVLAHARHVFEPAAGANSLKTLLSTALCSGMRQRYPD